MTSQDEKPHGAPEASKPPRSGKGRAKSSAGKRRVEKASSGELVSVTIEPGTMIGDYRVVKKLDEGGMGVVYEGVHPVIDKRVAIKLLHPHVARQKVSVARFIQEARAVNAIGHPEIVDVFGFGKFTDGRQYIIMEFLEGCHLLSYLNEKGPLDPWKACQLVRKIAGAMEAAHQKGVIHRDMKPENVFLLIAKNVTWPPDMKLLDFGLAKLVEDKFSKGPNTRMGATVGTPYYMAPEQCRGRTVDARTDIYALGIMFYEMITGRVPFFAEHAVDVLFMHLNQDPDPPSFWCDVPEEIEKLIMECISKPPEKRPKTMNGLIARIEAIESNFQEAEGRQVSSFTDLLATTADLLGKAQQDIFEKQHQERDASKEDFGGDSSGPETSEEESLDQEKGCVESGAEEGVDPQVVGNFVDSEPEQGKKTRTEAIFSGKVSGDADPEAEGFSPSQKPEHPAKEGRKEKTEKISLRASEKTARVEAGANTFSTRAFAMGVMLGFVLGAGAVFLLKMIF